MLYDKGENDENFLEILDEYTEALKLRTGMIDNLNKELKQIKRLRV